MTQLADSLAPFAAVPMVLIVDDEPRSRTLLKAVLQLDGYDLREASTGAEALQLAHECNPDLILLDVMMPEMNGFETCRRLRQHDRLQHVPILFLTALDDRKSRLEGLDAGADDFISKPIDTAELRIRIRTITKLNRFRKLYEERARFEQTVLHAPDGVVVTDAEGGIELINDAAMRLWSTAPALGTNLRILFPVGVIEELLAGLDGTEVVRHPRALEVAPAAPADPNTVIELIAARLPGGSVHFNLHDITERKRMENQLVRIQRVEVLGQLAGGLAHDLNNVLSSIDACAAGLLREAGTTPPMLIGTLRDAAQRGTEMLQQLLLFSRGTEEPPDLLDPLPICREVARLTQESQSGDLEVRLIVETTRDETVRIRSHNTQLHQILLNLVNNARDAMEGRGRLSVEFAVRVPTPEETVGAGPEHSGRRHAVITVADQGPGIAPDLKEKLFEPFFTTKAPGQGTGLGLPTVLLLVHRNGGFVTVESPQGAGARFSCFFPVEESLL